jgi:hypothetical protein
MIGIKICIVVLLIASIVEICYIAKNSEIIDFTLPLALFLSSFLIGGFLVIVLANDIFKDIPKPIDVYRGKTELEIHSINGIPQDTLVIWKNKSSM